MQVRREGKSLRVALFLSSIAISTLICLESIIYILTIFSRQKEQLFMLRINFMNWTFLLEVMETASLAHVTITSKTS